MEDRWSVVSLDDALRGLKAPRSLPDRAALITFDDGYRSVLEFVSPVLADFSVPAVVFVPTDYIGSSSLFDAGAAEPICSVEELQELEAAGVSIQSHGRSHVKLSTLAPSAVDELRRSKRSSKTPSAGRSRLSPIDTAIPAIQRSWPPRWREPATALRFSTAAHRSGFPPPMCTRCLHPDGAGHRPLGGATATVRSDLRRHLELATKARWRSLAEGRHDASQLGGLDSLLSRHVAPSAKRYPDRAGTSASALSVHAASLSGPSPARSWQAFARGEAGSQAAPWIAPRYAYEFRLRTEHDGEPVDLVTVVAEPPDEGLPSGPASEEQVWQIGTGGIPAVPNPAPVQ